MLRWSLFLKEWPRCHSSYRMVAISKIIPPKVTPLEPALPSTRVNSNLATNDDQALQVLKDQVHRLKRQTRALNARMKSHQRLLRQSFPVRCRSCCRVKESNAFSRVYRYSWKSDLLVSKGCIAVEVAHSCCLCCMYEFPYVCTHCYPISDSTASIGSEQMAHGIASKKWVSKGNMRVFLLTFHYFTCQFAWDYRFLHDVLRAYLLHAQPPIIYLVQKY